MRKALDDPRYDPVREVCATIGEGIMAGYWRGPPRRSGALIACAPTL
jgi:hypothetical protein